MLVEFLGLPASGKSTTLKAARRLLKARGLKVRDLASLDDMDDTLPSYTHRCRTTRAIYRYEQFRSEHPTCAGVIDRFGAGHLVPKTLLATVCARLQIHASNVFQGEVFATDEGLVHRAVHMTNRVEDEDPNALIRDFCAAMPNVDLIVVMDVPAATCYERALTRFADRAGLAVDDPKVKRRIHAVHGTPARLEKRAALQSRAIETLAARGFRITRIPQDADPDRAAALAGAAVADAAEALQAV